jgi:hypothetical protein
VIVYPTLARRALSPSRASSLGFYRRDFSITEEFAGAEARIFSGRFGTTEVVPFHEADSGRRASSGSDF